LEADGQKVIGVDLRDADVLADLGTPEGRQAAIDAVTEVAGGSLDGLVTWAGLPGLTERPGSLLVSVNYFGTIAMLEGLRPLLAKGDRPAAVAISSNSTTVQPAVPMGVVHAGEAASSLASYPATKTAVAWWIRRNAPAWAADGITLNAVAPGAVETPLLQASREDPTVGAFIDAFPIPVGRKGTADELAAFVQFLLGPDARFFCGSVVFVDGGTDAQARPDDFPVPM
jgi:NAD(P)-dependent dehydrogenase (short-subunit alcohol dehydrogenase family)